MAKRWQKPTDPEDGQTRTPATTVTNEESSRKKLQIGFVSKNFFDHSTGKWMRGMIRDFDRTRFHVTLIPLPPLHADKLAAAIQNAADKVFLPSGQWQEIRDQIAALELDVLVLTDVGMDTTLFALAFARLAPVQVGIAAAWPITSGIPTMDYMATFDVELATAQEHYTERLLRMPGILPYSLPEEQTALLGDLAKLWNPANAAEKVGNTAERDRLRFEFFGKLTAPTPSERVDAFTDTTETEKAVVYLCIQAPYKFHPDFDDILGEILRANRNAYIAVIWGKVRHWSQTWLARLHATLGEALMTRILLIPRIPGTKMMQLLAVADVVLDTWPYGGGVTSFEALAVGRPLLTLAYQTMPGRFTYAFYRKMGVLDCVAFSADEYAHKAIQLGLNSSYRADVSRRILAAAPSIFNDQVALRSFEEQIIAKFDERDSSRVEI
eukprot:COSAG05_NODE_783_length_7363_cov_40.108756_2_plen_439_part_00